MFLRCITAGVVVLVLAIAVMAADPKALTPDADWFPYLGFWLDKHSVVQKIYPGSGAERARLLPGDRLVSANGYSETSGDHHAFVAKLRGGLGKTVALVVQRDGKPYSLTLAYAKLPPAAAPTSASPGDTNSSASSDSLDQQLIHAIRKDQYFDEYYKMVIQGLSLLPKSIKQEAINAGITIVITPTLEELNNMEGGCQYQPRFKRVVMAEYKPDDVQAPGKRIPITLLHEFGHAYDDMHGYVSRTAEFREAYYSDAKQISEEYQKQLEYFLQEGNRGPTECFASLFARKYYRGPDKRLQALEACFPQTFKFVQNMKD